MITLREAIQALVAPQAEKGTMSYETIGDLNLQFSKVCYDSRQVEQGSLFVCIPGLKSDGHDFAAQAVSRGAVALIVERFLDLPISQVKVKDARLALGVVAAALYNQPAQLLRMCGVTGTNGKTTVTHLI
ncbi:MAG TPA: Mur ligase domain-containing protein, partial [Candidatus Deferrimicrobium sp.]|nr:Mur ligase domain-containing protein [Candidatus Deferrimicrobium sp.]